MQETLATWVPSLGREDPLGERTAAHLEERMAARSSILAWRIPWTEEPGGLQSIELQRVGHYWNNLAHVYTMSLIQNIWNHLRCPSGKGQTRKKRILGGKTQCLCIKERKVIFATYPSIPLPWKTPKYVPYVCCQGRYCCFVKSIRIPGSDITEFRKNRVVKWMLFLEIGLLIWIINPYFCRQKLGGIFNSGRGQIMSIF